MEDIEPHRVVSGTGTAVVDGVRVGWRLALEPMGQFVGWSLLRREQLPPGQVDTPELIGAGVSRASVSLRAVLATIVPLDLAAATGAVSGDRYDARRSAADLWSCGLADPRVERDAAVQLGRGLLPPILREELRSAAPGTRHTLTIATRGWLSAVPWDAVALDSDGDLRLIDRAVTWGGLSPTLFAGLSRLPASASMRHLAVVDPGPVAAEEGLPLYPGGYPDAFEDRFADGRLDHLGPGWDPMSADDFGDLLRDPKGWRSLCFLGHVQRGAVEAAGAAGLLFQLDGRAELLTARRWIAEPERWPAPARVCLIGCGSDDSMLLERSGLPVAALKAGAEFVTSTRWTLPTDREPGSATATTELAVAMVDAVAGDDPRAVIRDWQLGRLDRWRSTGDLDSSPLLWASSVTYRAPNKCTGSRGGGSA